MSYTDEGLLGTSMAGDEVFLLDLRLGKVSDLLAALAPLLGLAPERLTLLREGVVLAGGAELREVDGLTLRSQVKDEVPMLCRLKDVDLGPEIPVLGNLAHLPEGETIQAVRTNVCYVSGYPNQHRWLSYTSKEVVSCEFPEILEPWGFFPSAPQWRMPAGTSPARRAVPSCDVWTCQLQLPVKEKLDAHARRTHDRPIPRYQMIVDPNQFVHQQDGGPVWVPCEFDITGEGSCHLVGGDRSHLEPRLAEEVAQPVLQAALPLLAKLRRPQLLLQDRRLQVVFKEPFGGGGGGGVMGCAA